MCMYDASRDTHFGFCCDIDEEKADELASTSRFTVLFPRSPAFSYTFTSL